MSVKVTTPRGGPRLTHQRRGARTPEGPTGQGRNVERGTRELRTAGTAFRRIVVAAGVLAASAPAFAIDAGQQLRRFQSETQQRMQAGEPKSSPLPVLPPSSSASAAATTTARTHVSGFEIHGATRFSQAEMAAVLEDDIGRSLSTAEIHAAANRLMRLYRDAGYLLAKVFVPPQVFGEIVRLDVEEGLLEPGGIEVQDRGERVGAASVQSILDANLYFDRPLQARDLERALLLADDLPGTRIGSIIYPGREVGTARLRTVMSDEPLLSGNVDFDNFNLPQIGQYRLGATLYLNSPGGVGDQTVARLVSSGSRSNYVYLTYLRPVSPFGTRIGASIDYYGYDGTAPADLGTIDGHASNARLYLTHPIIRSRFTNLSLRTDVSYYAIDDRRTASGATLSADRRLGVVSVSLEGDETHDFLPNGTTLFDVTVTAGNVDLVGDPLYERFDASGPRTAGGFARLNLSLQRLQHLAGPWSLYASAAGQLSSKNLDPLERFYLGGSISIPGYPIGEVGGDQGAEIWVELRRDFAAPWGGALQAGLSYEAGWVQQQRNPWQGWNSIDPTLSNGLTLQSVGLQLTQTVQNTWVIRGLVGRQIGAKPPIQQLTGYDSDGRRADYRGWFQVIRYF
jgi:hemolysin activation/secretion protein